MSHIYQLLDSGRNFRRLGTLSKSAQNLGKVGSVASNISKTSDILRPAASAGTKAAAFSAESLIPWVGLAASIADNVSTFSKHDGSAAMFTDSDTRSRIQSRNVQTGQEISSVASTVVSLITSILSVL